jgi:hypothetical protein
MCRGFRFGEDALQSLVGLAEDQGAGGLEDPELARALGPGRVRAKQVEIVGRVGVVEHVGAGPGRDAVDPDVAGPRGRRPGDDHRQDREGRQKPTYLHVKVSDP